MEAMVSRYWWVLVLRGMLALLFGLAAVLWPGLTLTTLVLLFGAYALVDGVFAVITGIRHSDEQERRWSVLLEGVVGVIAGVLTFLWPDITALALLSIIAVWAVITGVLELAAAIRLRKVIVGEWMLALSGIASIIFGLLLIAFPGSGVLALIWLIGGYAIVFGVLLIGVGFRVRRRSHTFDRGAPRAV